jgi:ketosteroid isomerase-like protein
MSTENLEHGVAGVDQLADLVVPLGMIAHIHQRGRGKVSGVTVESRFSQVWTLRKGRIVHATHHGERADALAAAGVEE